MSRMGRLIVVCPDCQQQLRPAYDPRKEQKPDIVSCRCGCQLYVYPHLTNPKKVRCRILRSDQDIVRAWEYVHRIRGHKPQQSFLGGSKMDQKPDDTQKS